MSRTKILAASLLCAAFGSPLAAQTTQPPQSLAIRSMEGRDLFLFYCASCHGTGGRGDGPTAAALKIPPADLTTIAVRNGGKFPVATIEGFIQHEEARAKPAHGTSAMPVWGPIFRALDPSDTRARIRVQNLVAYLQTIQAKK